MTPTTSLPAGTVAGFSIHPAWWVLIALLLVLFYILYWQLITKRNKTQEAMSGIDVQLKKRYDLIPNILTIAQKYMEHERGLLTEITALRSKVAAIPADQASIGQKFELDNAIAGKMNQLLVNVEKYPEIKADQTMMTAMQTYSEVEEHIAAARRFYNSAANELKNAVDIFPSSLVAAILNIKAYPFFETDEQSRQAISAADYLK